MKKLKTLKQLTIENKFPFWVKDDFGKLCVIGLSFDKKSYIMQTDKGDLHSARLSSSFIMDDLYEKTTPPKRKLK